MVTIALGAKNVEPTSIPTSMEFKHGSRIFTQPGSLPVVALAQVIAAVREFDIEQIRPENEEPRSA